MGNFSKVLQHIRIQLVKVPVEHRYTSDGQGLGSDQVWNKTIPHQSQNESVLGDQFTSKEPGHEEYLKELEVKNELVSADVDSAEEVPDFPLDSASSYASSDATIDIKPTDEQIDRGSVSENRFECDQCDKRFATRDHLKSHSICHQTDRKYSCEFCTKSFKRRQNLKQHVAIHLNEKRHKCPICGKGFNTNSMLCSHRMVHWAKNEG